MIKKSLRKLVGLKKKDFDAFVSRNQIILQPARLIPTHKTGDEMALTSIFLSTLKLVKEYRASLFKELKLSRSGRVYYYTEASFPEISKHRIDGLIIIVIKGVITDAAFFEMKNKANSIDAKQIEQYIDISKKLKVNKLITISNEFVSDPSQSPIKIKTPRNFSLLHFSWTYLMTLGQLLLFKNEDNIEDEDQVEIMAETLHYFENSVSGIKGYTQMKSGWKELSENIRAQKPLKKTDAYIKEAVLSWYEEEKDLSLLLSRKLGVLVKSANKTENNLAKDIKRLMDQNYIAGSLAIDDAVSDIKIKAEFERRIVTTSIKVTPPLDKGNKAKTTWIIKQLEKCKKNSGELFKKVEDELWIEADIKYTKDHIKVKLLELGTLYDSLSENDIQSFQIVLIRSFGARFSSAKGFITNLEEMVLEYYETIVQHASTWTRPTPKIVQDIE